MATAIASAAAVASPGALEPRSTQVITPIEHDLDQNVGYAAFDLTKKADEASPNYQSLKNAENAQREHDRAHPPTEINQPLPPEYLSTAIQEVNSLAGQIIAQRTQNAT